MPPATLSITSIGLVGLAGKPWPPLPSLLHAHVCFNCMLNQIKNALPKGKEVPVSGFLHTWPWPAPRSSLSELKGSIGTEPASPKVCASSLTPDKWGMEQ